MVATNFELDRDNPVKLGHLIGEEGEEKRIAELISSLFTARQRPTDKSGRTFFHMRMTRVARGRCSYSTGQAARFQNYIERDGAVELDGEGCISFGNIGDDVEERRDFWKEVETFERRCDSRIQERIELELPFELRNFGTTPRRLLMEFTRVFSERNLPFHVVVHIPPVEEKMSKKGAPIAIASPKNIHAHIVWSERPFERKGRSEWLFERKKNRDVHLGMFPAVLRNRYCEIANKYLSRRPNIKKRYTPHSFADMGLDIKPLWHASRASMHALSRGIWSDEILSLTRVRAENQLQDLQKEEEILAASLAEIGVDIEAEKAIDISIPVFIVEKTPGTYTRCIWLGEPEPDQEPITKTTKGALTKVVERLANQYGFQRWRIEDYGDKKISEQRQFERTMKRINAYHDEHSKLSALHTERKLLEENEIQLTPDTFIQTVRYVWRETYGFSPEDKVLDQAALYRRQGVTPVEFVEVAGKKRGLLAADPANYGRAIIEVARDAEQEFVRINLPPPPTEIPLELPIITKITSPNPILKKGYWVAQDFVGPGEIPGYFKDMDDVKLQSLLEDTELAINAITADPSIAPKHKKRGFETGIYMIKFEQKFRAKRNAEPEISRKPRKQKGWDRGL